VQCKTRYVRLVLIVLVGVLSGCASMTGSPTRSVRIDSTPQNIAYSIVDQEGNEVANGVTPDQVILHSSTKPYTRAKYTVNYSSNEFGSQSQALDARLSVYYFLNYFLGYHGFFGALIIDPFTGAMYTLPGSSSATMTPNENTTEQPSGEQELVE